MQFHYTSYLVVAVGPGRKGRGCERETDGGSCGWGRFDLAGSADSAAEAASYHGGASEPAEWILRNAGRCAGRIRAACGGGSAGGRDVGGGVFAPDEAGGRLTVRLLEGTGRRWSLRVMRCIIGLEGYSCENGCKYR